MGRANTSFCLNRFPLCFRVGSQRKMDPKPISTAVGSGSDKSWSLGSETGGRRIMVVVNSSRESKTALQWTLSHTVQNHDTVVVVAVIKSTSMRDHGDLSEKKKDPRNYAPLCAMKNFCQARRPEVEVEISLVKGEEPGPAIVAEAKRQAASLLVLGQKKRSMAWRLMMTMWARRRKNRARRAVIEYCIKNASCMTLAVRKKSRRGGGGYLITTRRHKNFWLLA